MSRDPNSPLHVCFVIDRLIRGGTELQVVNLIRWLDRNSVRPFLCLLDGNDELSRALTPKDCPTIRLGVRKLLSFHALKQGWRFRRFLRANGIDVVQTFFPDSTRFAAPMAKLAGVRTVFGSRRNIGHALGRGDARIARFYNRFFVDRIIANCEAARQSVVKQENARPEQVFVVPNIIDAAKFQHIPPWAPKPAGRPRLVGMVGNLNKVKGPDIFIHAAAIVLQEYPDAQFRIAGGGVHQPYEDLIRNLRIGESTRLCGAVSDIPAFLSEIDVAVLPSRAEGLSNALLEHMAAGRPVVATDVGGNREVIRDGINGFLVEPENPAALAAAVCRLLSDESICTRISVAARDTILETCSPQIVCRKTADAFRAVAVA